MLQDLLNEDLLRFSPLAGDQLIKNLPHFFAPVCDNLAFDLIFLEGIGAIIGIFSVHSLLIIYNLVYLVLVLLVFLILGKVEQNFVLHHRVPDLILNRRVLILIKHLLGHLG